MFYPLHKNTPSQGSERVVVNSLCFSMYKSIRIFSNIPKNIPQIVDKFTDINKRFYEAIKFHKIIDQLY